MEDGKKKRSRKKKNKQAAKPAETVASDSKESRSENPSHDPDVGHDKNGQSSSGGRDAPDDIGSNTDTDRDGPIANGGQDAHLANSEKQHWLDREASSQDKIKQLQAQNDAMRQKEAILEEKIKQLLKDKDESSQKQGNLEQIKQLQKENDDYLQKEAALEMKILQLEREKGSWLQKEIGLEEKINHLMDETAALNLKMVSLQEKIKQMERERDSWVMNENSAKELIASLNDDKSKLHAQVMALEQSRESLLEEKQQLTENISNLQLQFGNLKKAPGSPHATLDNKMTSQDSDVDYQIEASRALIDKLITENSELVEKVNELYAELDRRAMLTEDSLPSGSGTGAITAQPTDAVNISALMPNMAVGADDKTQAANSTPEAFEMPVAGSTGSLEDIIMMENQGNGGHVGQKDWSGLETPSEITESDEIVQISLDGHEVQETNLEVAQDHEKNDDVPLTDAPLIGAPFRLISFVARYVSGADLINKNTRNSG